MAMTDYPSSSKRPFSDMEVEVEVEGGNKKKRNLYQVFISHRGPETKHSLARHMYDMLRVRGFEVFLDVTEMETGEEIPLQILEAISTSAVQIAIISLGFGESVWCLKELVMMMQKHTDGSSLVIPVFYEVEPADLRFYKDDVPFCKKFRYKHVGRQSHETMEEWKKALKELANLSGFPWDEHKGKLVELVVKRVCDYTHHAQLHIPRHVIGIEKKLVETMDDIMKPQGKVKVVSITGIGGIGKTTFAKALFNNMCSHFNRHCFVDDVKGLLEKYGTVHIQKLLLEGLLNLDIRISNSGNGQYELRNRLVNQKVLLVLDNIDGTVMLNDIFLEDFAILCHSSIIIITSRVTCNFKIDCKIVPVEIPKLDFQKSERLFCSQAFGVDESEIQEEHHMLVRQIVEKCAGLPLALVLFGKHMSELDPSCWTDFLEIHRDSLPSDLSACLQITYDSLDDLQKTLFLDVAIFFHGQGVMPVRNLWDDRASEFKISLDVLKRKLLIEVTEEDLFRMHDILRDFGRTIVDNVDKLNPGCRSRLWREEDIVKVLSGEQEGTDKVEALSLVSKGSVIRDADEDGNPRPWKVDAFSTMPSLKMLFLRGNCIAGDLSMLPNGLEFLRWTEFPFDAVSIPLKSAKVVDFWHGRQKPLWDLESMEPPTKLRELRLSLCSELQEIRWPGKVSLLKHLQLYSCSSLRSIAHNFSSLQRLECLDINSCYSLESLPVELGQLTNLQELDLSFCINIKELPESLGHLTNLQELDLSFCQNIKELPASLCQLTNLRELGLKSCSELEKLPENFGLLKNLRSKLCLYGCEKLKKLPVSFGDLQQLQDLNMGYCESLEMLPDSFVQLTNLKYLDLSRCKKLKMLPESFGQLTNLQKLNVSLDKELKKLPESFDKLNGLEFLYMRGCTNLEMLPDSFGQLTNLGTLRTNGCKIEKIAHGGRLQGWHELKIRKASPITKLVLMEDNPERRPVLSRVVNNHLLSNTYKWLEELPLYPITIMDTCVSGVPPCINVLDELASKGAAIHKCLFRRLQPSPLSSKTWVAEGEHCKFKCIGAAICFDFYPDGFGQRKVSNMEISFGCTKWDPIYYTTGGGTNLFCMAVYDSPEEISLDKMSVCLSDESDSPEEISLDTMSECLSDDSDSCEEISLDKMSVCLSDVPLPGIGWVCYFLERDEDLLRHVRNFCYGNWTKHYSLSLNKIVQV